MPDREDIGHVAPYEWESYDDWQHRRQLELELRDDPPIYSPESTDGGTDWLGRAYVMGLIIAAAVVVALTLSYCSVH